MMKNFPATLQSFPFGEYRVQAYVPDAAALQQWYTIEKEKNGITPFPYWAKVWPASLALCTFIADQPHFIQNKKVLELAAGLGLPSLLSSQLATEVICSDYINEAVETMQTSIEHNKLLNVHSQLLDWNHLPADLKTDILLLSDINYDPEVFESLFQLIEQFIKAGTTILLATPQRIMAKPFIEQLMKYCLLQKEIEVNEKGMKTICSVLVLKKQ
jgi:predicted nicotinamide N-methyase